MSNDESPQLDEVPEVNRPGQYFDAGGVAISMLAWARLTQDESYKVLAREQVGDFEVITAWLGRDQAGWGGPPLIFGTIARRLSTHEFLEEQETFAATAAKALTNQATLVDILRRA
jgi:hypothetical protein